MYVRYVSVWMWWRFDRGIGRVSAYLIHSYTGNLIKATLPLNHITSGKQIWILHSASSFKHPACDLLGGEQWRRLMRDGEHVLTFSLSSFVLMHLISPPSSFVEHLSFPINRHQSLYPCWVKNCAHYLCHVVYRNSRLSTDKREVKQLRVTHTTAVPRQRGINHS